MTERVGLGPNAAHRDAAARGAASVLRETPAEDGPLFTIRELCDAFDVTARALRFYEDQGLLAPLRRDQRRLYRPRDRARLALILRGKRFGFALAEIRELLDLYDVGDQQVTQLEKTLVTAHEKLALLESRERDIRQAIGELKDQIALVENMLSDRK